ncbi:phage virion morphogenesis protein [Lachnospiraceae bacterium]|nr:phage virion morphogenesis protein [Lachnospiraceae bacterium]
MSSIQVNVDGDVEELMKRLRSMENVDFKGVLNAVGEGLRTSTAERFERGEAPDGSAWKQSVRVRDGGGKTLIDTAVLRNSINVRNGSAGVAVGTNDIRAATHQFGDSRTIRAKNGRKLTFQAGGRWRSVESVTIHIPARPFLGISDEDEQEIKETLEEALAEAMEG